MQEGLRQPPTEAQIFWGTDSPPVGDPVEAARQALADGDLDQAESLARSVANRDMSDGVAIALLAEILEAKGDDEGAAEWFHRAIVANPTHKQAYYQLAQLFLKKRRADKAVDVLRRALDVDPRDFESLMALGEALVAKKAYDEAMELFRRAAGTDPGRPEPHVWLAEAYFSQRCYEDCLGAAQRALQCSNRNARAYEVYGRALAALGQTKEAISAFRTAIKLNPLSAGAYAYMATGYLEMAQPAQALEAAIQAVHLQPELPPAQVSRASALRLLGHIDESMVACHKAILTQSKQPEVHTILGHVYMDCGLPDEAAKSFERGLAVDDLLRPTHSALLVSRQFTLKKTPEEVLQEAKQWQEKFGEALYPRPTPSKRIQRIGFVSPDFNDSPVGRTILALAKALRGMAIESYFYGYGLEDAITDQFKEIGYWRSITGLDDETASTIVAEDKIDALVDSTGHMERNRIGVFLQRPCGIQVSWLGNMGPIGTEAIDAVLSDSSLAPASADAFHTCPVVRMGHRSMLFTPPSVEAAPGPLPSDAATVFTYGAVCNSRQVNRRVVAAWSEILKSTPRSRFVIKARGLHSTAIRKQFLSWFDANGVPADRVVCLGNTSLPTHLATYQHIDLCLDPFPWSGAQASMESAWMGLPTLTWKGHAQWQRGASATMKSLGLDEFVVDSEQEYIRQASRMAGQPDQLRHLRTKIRGLLTDSPFCDPGGFAQEFVKALESLTGE